MALGIFENKAEVIRFKISFLESALGTSPNDPEIYMKYIASKAPNAQGIEEEVEAIGVDGVAEQGMTVFPRINGDKNRPGFWPYQVKGFFKSGQQALNDMVPNKEDRKKKNSGYMSVYKRRIDTMIFVKAVDARWTEWKTAGTEKQLIEIHLPEGGTISSCERPLRAQTMQGERVALAKSESVPEGSWMEFDVKILDPELKDYLFEWMEFGAYNGLGQWRNSGKGSFVYWAYDTDGNLIQTNAE
jgi:hypothetical protein